jgi:hypothetical protein
MNRAANYYNPASRGQLEGSRMAYLLCAQEQTRSVAPAISNAPWPPAWENTRMLTQAVLVDLRWMLSWAAHSPILCRSSDVTSQTACAIWRLPFPLDMSYCISTPPTAGLEDGSLAIPLGRKQYWLMCISCVSTSS